MVSTRASRRHWRSALARPHHSAIPDRMAATVAASAATSSGVITPTILRAYRRAAGQHADGGSRQMIINLADHGRRQDVHLDHLVSATTCIMYSCRARHSGDSRVSDPGSRR
jgi:hypothetical protein